MDMEKDMEKDQKKDEDDKENKQQHHKQEEQEEQEGVGAHSVAGRDRLQLERHSDQPAAHEQREAAQLGDIHVTRKTRRRT